MVSNTHVIFLPGCFGTSLMKGNEKVWPISSLTKIKYFINNFTKPFTQNIPEDNHGAIKEIIESLQNSNIVAGPVIDKHYSSIISLLTKATNGNLTVVGYDWRQPIAQCIKTLDEAVSKIVCNDKKITIIGHSAGGLIAYKYLNQYLKHEDTPNFKNINRLISIGSPIQGCTRGLAAIIGLSMKSGLTIEDISTLLESGVFELIFDLCPINIHNLFFYKDTRLPLQSRQIIECLHNIGFSRQRLNRIFRSHTEIQNKTPNQNINYLFISGMMADSRMVSNFLIDNNNLITAVQCTGAGDGTVLLRESTPHPEFLFRDVYVNGKHSYLTEIDEVQNIILDELKAEYNTTYSVETILQSTKKNKKVISLNILVNQQKYPIKNLSARHITFNCKTYMKDISGSIKKEKEGFFRFKVEKEFGFLLFRDVFFEYEDSDKILQKIFIKDVRSEMETDNNELLL